MKRREFLGHTVRTAAMAGGAALARRAGFGQSTAGGTSRRASVVDFGADPTGEHDSTAPVRKAIASLAKRNARLVFPAGKYTFAASDGALMEFREYEGLEIFGNGAELSFAGATRPLLLHRCQDIEIHDIVIDWTRPPFSQGKVRSTSGRDVAIALDPDYALEGTGSVVALLAFEAHAKGSTPSSLGSHRVVSAQSRGAQSVVLTLEEPASLPEGTLVALLHPGAGQAAIELQGCEQVLLETVMLHSSPGVAVRLHGCRDLTFDTVRVLAHPGSGRLISSCGTGVSLFDCAGSVTAQHAIFDSTARAGMEVQQSLWRIAEVIDPQVALVTSPDGQPVPAWLLPRQGTYMQINQSGTLKLLGEIALTKAESAPGGMKLSFEETLSPAVGKGALLGLSATDQPQLKLDDCHFRGGAQHGLVAQSRLRIHNSSFSGYNGAAILLAPDPERMRGPVVQSVHINDCTFEQCATAARGPRGTITIDTAADRAQAMTPPDRINTGITLQRNTFNRLGGPAIYCAGTNWLDVESNRFRDCDLLHPAGSEPAAIVLRNVDESTISQNETVPTARIVMMDCTEKVKVGDNTNLTTATS